MIRGFNPIFTLVLFTLLWGGIGYALYHFKDMQVRTLKFIATSGMTALAALVIVLSLLSLIITKFN